MLRGEVRMVDLDPARGSEANKRRPAVIVSNDRANATATRLRRGVVTVVPVTSNVSRVLPFQTLLPAEDVGLAMESKAQAEQVRSIAVERVARAGKTITVDVVETAPGPGCWTTQQITQPVDVVVVAAADAPTFSFSDRTRTQECK